MELGETVAMALLDGFAVNCPFNEEGPDVASEEGEAPAKDDLEAADAIQESSGGTLGENLGKGSPAGWGKGDTINPIYPPSNMDAKPRNDSTTDASLRVKVGSKDYGYVVAAHHLIPGDASLSPSGLYKSYMKKGGKVTTDSGKSYTMKTHIGYNVNGNHNGVWLPGNYAIRVSKPQFNSTGKTWRVLTVTDEKWCYAYMTACVEKAGGQFHDSHGRFYSPAVLDILDKIETKLRKHQDACKECESKTDVYPPYSLKTRLYLLSSYLRMQVRIRQVWKCPWITSDKFKEDLQKHGRVEPDKVELGVIALGPGGGS